MELIVLFKRKKRKEIIWWPACAGFFQKCSSEVFLCSRSSGNPKGKAVAPLCFRYWFFVNASFLLIKGSVEPKHQLMGLVIQNTSMEDHSLLCLLSNSAFTDCLWKVSCLSVMHLALPHSSKFQVLQKLPESKRRG